MTSIYSWSVRKATYWVFKPWVSLGLIRYAYRFVLTHHFHGPDEHRSRSLWRLWELGWGLWRLTKWAGSPLLWNVSQPHWVGYECSGLISREIHLHKPSSNNSYSFFSWYLFYYSCYSNPYRRYLCQLTSMSWWPIVCRPCCLFHVLLLFRIVAIYDPRIDKGLRAKLHHSSNLGNWTRTVAYSTRLSQDLRSQYSEVYPSPWKIRGVLRMGAQCILISEDVDFR